MIKPEGFDSAKESFDGFSSIPKGVYKFKILRFENGFAKTNNAPRITAKVDIEEGNYAETFKEMSIERNKDLLLKVGYNIEGKGLNFLKGFLTSVERANIGFKFNWENDQQIVGKHFYGYLSATEKWYEISGIRSEKENVPEPKQREQTAQNQQPASDDLPF